jgi:hypothetical protein
MYNLAVETVLIIVFKPRRIITLKAMCNMFFKAKKVVKHSSRLWSLWSLDQCQTLKGQIISFRKFSQLII